MRPARRGVTMDQTTMLAAVLVLVDTIIFVAMALSGLIAKSARL
jgi:hypothetical protein